MKRAMPDTTPRSLGGARRLGRLVAVPSTVLLALSLAACGTQAKSATTVPSTTTSTVAPAMITGGEVALVSSVRPTIDALTTALQSGDLAKSKEALGEYDYAWNGIEVYVNFRNVAIYNKLEKDLQDGIDKALEADKPDLAAQVAKAQELGQVYDTAIAAAKAGPAISPLFDDVTALRIVRADLRRTTNLIAENEVNEAKETFEDFMARYPQIKDRVNLRSDTANDEIAAAMDTVDKAFETPNQTAAVLKPLVANLSTRYNYAVSLWNAAARNADIAKKTYTPADVTSVASLRSLEAATSTSIEAWKKGDYAGATAALNKAKTAFAGAQPALAAKKSDTSLKTALDAYTPLVAAAGDQAAVSAASKAVIEAGKVGEQALAGQFWTDAAFQQAVKQAIS